MGIVYQKELLSSCTFYILESVKLEQLAGTVGNKTKFLCKHHNRNDKAFSSKLTFWKKNDDEFVEYSDEIVEKQNKQTILSTVAEEGDTIVCALKLKSGEMETSNLVIVKFAERSTSEKSTVTLACVFFCTISVADAQTLTQQMLSINYTTV